VASKDRESESGFNSSTPALGYRFSLGWHFAALAEQCSLTGRLAEDRLFSANALNRLLKNRFLVK
jgi:hypothetical protein